MAEHKPDETELTTPEDGGKNASADSAIVTGVGENSQQDNEAPSKPITETRLDEETKEADGKESPVEEKGFARTGKATSQRTTQPSSDQEEQIKGETRGKNDDLVEGASNLSMYELLKDVDDVQPVIPDIPDKVEDDSSEPIIEPINDDEIPSKIVESDIVEENLALENNVGMSFDSLQIRDVVEVSEGKDQDIEEENGSTLIVEEQTADVEDESEKLETPKEGAGETEPVSIETGEAIDFADEIETEAGNLKFTTIADDSSDPVSIETKSAEQDDEEVGTTMEGERKTGFEPDDVEKLTHTISMTKLDDVESAIESNDRLPSQKSPDEQIEVKDIAPSGSGILHSEKETESNHADAGQMIQSPIETNSKNTEDAADMLDSGKETIPDNTLKSTDENTFGSNNDSKRTGENAQDSQEVAQIGNGNNQRSANEIVMGKQREIERDDVSDAKSDDEALLERSQRDDVQAKPQNTVALDREELVEVVQGVEDARTESTVKEAVGSNLVSTGIFERNGDDGVFVGESEEFNETGPEKNESSIPTKEQDDDEKVVQNDCPVFGHSERSSIIEKDSVSDPVRQIRIEDTDSSSSPCGEQTGLLLPKANKSGQKIPSALKRESKEGIPDGVPVVEGGNEPPNIGESDPTERVQSQAVPSETGHLVVSSVDSEQGSNSPLKTAEDIVPVEEGRDETKHTESRTLSAQDDIDGKMAAESCPDENVIVTRSTSEQRPDDEINGYQPQTEAAVAEQLDIQTCDGNVQAFKNVTDDTESNISTVPKSASSIETVVLPKLDTQEISQRQTPAQGVARKQFGDKMPLGESDSELSIPFDERKSSFQQKKEVTSAVSPPPSKRKVAIPAVFASPSSGSIKPITPTASPKSSNKTASVPVAFSSPIRLWDVTTSERFTVSPVTRSTSRVVIPTNISKKTAEILDIPLHRPSDKKAATPSVLAATSSPSRGSSKIGLDEKIRVAPPQLPKPGLDEKIRVTPPQIPPVDKTSTQTDYKPPPEIVDDDQPPQLRRGSKASTHTDYKPADDEDQVSKVPLDSKDMQSEKDAYTNAQKHYAHFAENVMLCATETEIETLIMRPFDEPPTAEELLLRQGKIAEASMAINESSESLSPPGEDTGKSSFSEKQAVADVRQTISSTTTETVKATEDVAQVKDVDKNTDTAFREIGVGAETEHLQDQAMCCSVM
eukprot:scaffold2767_cov177-Amphora_coffeaeformis.AAC.13